MCFVSPQGYPQFFPVIFADFGGDLEFSRTEIAEIDLID